MINSEDVIIKKSFVTTKGGVICWVKVQKHIADKVFRMAPRPNSNDCQVVTFVHALARKRKKNIEKIFLEYKREVDKDIRFLMKNGTLDLQIFLKKHSVYGHVPYREFNLGLLGEIHDLETKTQTDEAQTDH